MTKARKRSRFRFGAHLGCSRFHALELSKRIRKTNDNPQWRLPFRVFVVSSFRDPYRRPEDIENLVEMIWDSTTKKTKHTKEFNKSSLLMSLLFSCHFVPFMVNRIPSPALA